MKENKYIAWEKNMKQIIPVINIDFANQLINADSAWRMFYEIELMQSTGLFDKNGKEIYEDYKCIITKPSVRVIGYIKFQQGCYMFVDYKTGKFNTINALMLQGYEIEVVGNIYEANEVEFILDGNDTIRKEVRHEKQQ